MSNELVNYYNENDEELDLAFEEFLLENDWGSGEDKINAQNAEIFWEFVQSYKDKTEIKWRKLYQIL